MLRIVPMSVLLLFACSCGPSIEEKLKFATIVAARDARWAKEKADKEAWPGKFEAMLGKPVKGLIEAWDKPEKIEKNKYYWVSRSISQQGGYYVTDGYTRQTIYGEGAFITGFIEIPMERYVEPYIEEKILCEIWVTTQKNGIITHAHYKGAECMEKFPLPEQ